MNWTDLRLRLRAILFRQRVEQDLDEELSFHLEMAARKNAAAGANETESARLARLRFGGLDRFKEECRDERRTSLIETTWQDVRYALRGFRRSPVFAITVIATIALGLGVNTALFTILNAYVLRPLSIRDPNSVYGFTWLDRSGNGHAFTRGEFDNFQAAGNQAFEETAATRFLFARVNGHPLMGRLVTGNYFRMLGVNAALGRTLLPEDTAKPGAERVIVLSHTAWQNKFGGDPSIVGRKLLLRGSSLEVIGVAQPGFNDLGDAPLDYWAPSTMSAALDDSPALFDIIGRLKPGWDTARAKAALAAWSKLQTADRPNTEKAVGVLLTSKATAIPMTAELVAAATPLFLAFGLVLLLACANVTNMMLARAMARQREIGVRLSLGAARARLIRQLLTESVLLALPAGLAGVAISQLVIDASIRVMFATIPSDMAEFIHVIPLSVDLRVIAFMLAAALASAIFFGLAPALQATRIDTMLAARGEFTNDLRPMRLRNALVVAQVTICVLLLISSGILIRGAGIMTDFHPGFQTRGVIVMSVEEKSRPRLLARLGNEPAIETTGAASAIPFDGLPPSVPISAGPGEAALNSFYNSVSPDFFNVLEIPILRGRNFTREEMSSQAPVTIISEAAAQRLWPGRDALGQVVQIKRDRAPIAARVIGVAPDIYTCSIPYGKDPAMVYLPAPPAAVGASLLIRVKGDVETVRRELDTALAAELPGAVAEIHRSRNSSPPASTRFEPLPGSAPSWEA